MYAVMRTGGKQYRVAPDDVLNIEKIPGEIGDTVAFTDILMVGGEGEPIVGGPVIAGASIAAEVVDQGRGPKIIVFKKKRRQNYRRQNGHRQDLTTIRIVEILTDGKKPKAQAKKTAPAAKPKVEAAAEDKPKAVKAKDKTEQAAAKAKPEAAEKPKAARSAAKSKTDKAEPAKGAKAKAPVKKADE